MSSTDRPPCHISRGPLCINKKEIKDMGVEFMKAYVTYTEMLRPQVKGETNECMKDIYRLQYWEAKEELEDMGGIEGVYAIIGITAGAAVVIIATLVIIYFLKGKEREEASDQMVVNEE